MIFINKVILIGRLTRDPDARWSQGEEQTCIARYTLAVDRGIKAKSENQKTADFPSVVAFGRNGEFAEKYLKSGMKIAVVGRLQTGSYVNKDGIKVYTTDVVVEHHEFVESKGQQDSPLETENAIDNSGFMSIPDGIDEELPFV